MKTAWYDSEISQDVKSGYHPYGLNRTTLDQAASTVAKQIIEKKLAKEKSGLEHVALISILS